CIGSNFMDYLLPTAWETPQFELGETVTPSPHHPLGAKGVGESPTVGSPAAYVNAVIDALSPYGVTNIDMPVTSDKVWAALRADDRDDVSQRGLARHFHRTAVAQTAAAGVWGQSGRRQPVSARGADRLPGADCQSGGDGHARGRARRGIRGGGDDGPLRRGRPGNSPWPSRPGREPDREHSP